MDGDIQIDVSSDFTVEISIFSGVACNNLAHLYSYRESSLLQAQSGVDYYVLACRGSIFNPLYDHSFQIIAAMPEQP